MTREPNGDGNGHVTEHERLPLAKILRNAFHNVLHRYQVHGPSAGWVALSTLLVNGAVRALNPALPRGRRACPCCGWRGFWFRSMDIGLFRLPDMQCPACRSHDRQRMLSLLFAREPDLLRGMPGPTLHYAPEPHVRQFLMPPPEGRVVSIDIDTRRVAFAPFPKVAMDAHHLPFAADSVAHAVCIHVLEHVADDRRALAELRRVLMPGGRALVMVPLDPSLDATDEWGAPNPIIFDHVRNYSARDFPERLGGFEVRAVAPDSLLDPAARRRFAIRDSEIVYICAKPL